MGKNIPREGDNPRMPRHKREAITQWKPFNTLKTSHVILQCATLENGGGASTRLHSLARVSLIFQSRNCQLLNGSKSRRDSAASVAPIWRQSLRKGSPYFSPFTSTPFVLGHEIVGDIAEIGDAVDGFPVGTRVVIEPALSCKVRGISPECPQCRNTHFANCENITKGNISAGIQTGYCRDTGGWVESVRPCASIATPSRSPTVFRTKGLYSSNLLPARYTAF